MSKTSRLIDCHTHLFPRIHEGYHLSGIQELLNYHYLIPELAKCDNFSNSLLKSSKSDIARFAWENLFMSSCPSSYATLGIKYVLDKYGLYNTSYSYDQLIKEYSAIETNFETILEECNLKYIVMTNNPFDKSEWSLFELNNWDRDIYKSSIRIDEIFESIFNESYNDWDYLEHCIQVSGALYVALSLRSSQISILNSQAFDPLYSLLKKYNLPFYLMIGVERQVNPLLGLAGDAIEVSSEFDKLSFVLRNNPDIRFILSHLHFASEHYLCVLSRKFSNLTLSGSWWFLSTPSAIQATLNLRTELLGKFHIPFFSDSRIDEHLLYKSKVFKESISNACNDVTSYGLSLDITTFLDEMYTYTDQYFS